MRRPFSLSRPAFTFVELLVILAISLFGMALAVRRGRQCQRCQKPRDLQIQPPADRHALALYANENSGNFPRLPYDPQHADKPHFYTAPDGKDPFAKEGPVNDVTAILFLLIRTEDIQPSAFICPSTVCEAIKFGGKTARIFPISPIIAISATAFTIRTSAQGPG